MWLAQLFARLTGRSGRDHDTEGRHLKNRSLKRHMPNNNQNREFVTLKSGKKRYVYRDYTREKKQWCVTEAGSTGKVLHFYEVEIQGNAYCVTRPATGLKREDGTKLGGFLVTTASLRGWRKPAEERSAAQPYRAVTA